MLRWNSPRPRAALLCILGLACSPLLGCGEQAPPGSTEQDRVGSVALNLRLGDSIDLTSVSYEISSNLNLLFRKTGTLDIQGNVLRASIGTIPAGGGYTIVLRASGAEDAHIACEGSASFDIRAFHATPVDVVLRCRLPHSNSGSVLVNGTLNACPSIDGLSAAPLEVSVGQSAQLSATASDLDAAPAALRYHWSAESGSFTQADSESTAWRCSRAGNFNVQVEASDGDCSDKLSVTIACVNELTRVAATVETVPVAHVGDAADDPAIWVHPSNPGQSLIIGTDKAEGGGLGVYALDGSLLQTLTVGKLNNVDLRDGFALSGVQTTLVTAGNRSDNSIAIFALDAATRRLSDVAARSIVTLETYGSCMYHSAISGKLYYFVDSKAGEIEQWELFESASTTGKVDALKVRTLKQLSSQPEACAADDATGKLYVGEEDVGLWKFDAEPSVVSGPGWEGELIADVASGRLVADVEGVAVVSTGANEGYLLVSNQGDDSYAVLDRQPPHAWIKSFAVARGSSCIDPVTGSDGIDATARNLGPAFPHGVFVTQDDTNDLGNQNFKLVPLEHILELAPALDDRLCSAAPAPDAGVPESDAGSADAAQGWGTQYCLDFCQKCQDCYATGSFSEGDCHYQTAKPNFARSDCEAGCAVAATPGAAAHATLTEGWQALSCAGFDDAM